MQATERFGIGTDPDGDGIVNELTRADIMAQVKERLCAFSTGAARPEETSTMETSPIVHGTRKCTTGTGAAVNLSEDRRGHHNQAISPLDIQRLGRKYVMPTPKIVGIEKVFEAVGFETTFHDAEVLSVCLDRSEKPVLALCLLTPTRRKDPEHPNPDYIVWIHFEDVDHLRIEGFNHQNVVQEIVLRENAQRMDVRVAGLFGIDCSFTCAGGKVVSVGETTMRVGILSNS